MYGKTLERIALLSQIKELSLTDKPGLVTPTSNGCHKDMDYRLMRRGIISERGYFNKMFESGFNRESFSRARETGKSFERKLLSSTGGVNTHTGSIFQLGVMVYLIGKIKSRGEIFTRDNFFELIREELKRSEDIGALNRESRYGARLEVTSGYSLTEESLRLPLEDRLYFIISKAYDTNILRRGGADTLKELQLMSGKAVYDKSIRQKVKNFVSERYISPGGSADILINSIFVEGFLTFEESFCKRLPFEILNEKENIGMITGGKYAVVYSLIFPGWIKDTELLREKFFKYKELIDALLDKPPETVRINDTGMRAVYRLDEHDDFESIKKYFINLEKIGIIDIDVYGDRMYDRVGMGLPLRECIVCGGTAKHCSINRAHTAEELIGHAQGLLKKM